MADDGDEEIPPPTVGDLVLLAVNAWALVHGLAFAIAILIAAADGTLCCTKLTWLQPPCAALTDSAAAEVSALLQAEVWCIVADAAVALPLHKLLTAKSCIIRGRRWAAAVVEALAWLALAATAGIHVMRVASDRIYLAAHPGASYFFVSVVLVSGCLAVDLLLAGFLLCYRRQWLGEHHQGDDDREV